MLFILFEHPYAAYRRRKKVARLTFFPIELSTWSYNFQYINMAKILSPKNESTIFICTSLWFRPLLMVLPFSTGYQTNLAKISRFFSYFVFLFRYHKLNDKSAIFQCWAAKRKNNRNGERYTDTYVYGSSLTQHTKYVYGIWRLRAEFLIDIIINFSFFFFLAMVAVGVCVSRSSRAVGFYVYCYYGHTVELESMRVRARVQQIRSSGVCFWEKLEHFPLLYSLPVSVSPLVIEVLLSFGVCHIIAKA